MIPQGMIKALVFSPVGILSAQGILQKSWPPVLAPWKTNLLTHLPLYIERSLKDP